MTELLRPPIRITEKGRKGKDCPTLKFWRHVAFIILVVVMSTFRFFRFYESQRDNRCVTYVDLRHNMCELGSALMETR